MIKDQPNLRSRWKLLDAIGRMPDEAFGWVVAAFMPTRGRVGIFPDGLGGFRQESRDSIKAVREAAEEYIDATDKG